MDGGNKKSQSQSGILKIFGIFRLGTVLHDENISKLSETEVYFSNSPQQKPHRTPVGHFLTFMKGSFQSKPFISAIPM